jgi:hypothetical protein
MSTQVFASEKLFLVETPIIAPSSHADFTINTCLDKFLLEKKIAFHLPLTEKEQVHLDWVLEGFY